MELAQKEKLTLEEWKKLTDPFKEWLVEAKGKFENLQHEKGYDAALINQEKLTVRNCDRLLAIEKYNDEYRIIFLYI